MARFLSTRRSFLSSTLLLPAMFSSCRSMLEKPHGMETKLNLESHWARREEWTGLEMVKGVVNMSDHFLMVERNDPMHWDFPGGIVRHNIHGPKTEENTDLVRAVTEYVHAQGMVQIEASQAKLIAYGYGIDVVNDRTYLVHWLTVNVPSKLPPTPHANLRNILDTRWVGMEDPYLKRCLEARIEEFKQAKEGGTVLLQPCRI